MTKRFTCRHLKNGYAAMGGNKRRPHYPSAKNRSVAEAIAHAANVARRIAAAAGKKKAR